MVKHLHVPLEDGEHEELVEWRSKVERAQRILRNDKRFEFESWADFLLEVARGKA